MSGIEWAPIRIPIERRLQVIQLTMLLFLHDFLKSKCHTETKVSISHTFLKLQTLAVLCWISTFTLLNTVGTGLFLYVLFYSSTYRWIPILYMAWAVYDWKTPEQGGRKWKYT